LGDVFFEARLFAIVLASLLKSPFSGNVDSVCTLADHRRPDLAFEEEAVRFFRAVRLRAVDGAFVFLALGIAIKLVQFDVGGLSSAVWFVSDSLVGERRFGCLPLPFLHCVFNHFHEVF